MLEIRIIMNSAVEEIFAFKTCCGARSFDQNLEIHLKNGGPVPIVVPSRFDLETGEGVKRIDNLSPPGEHRIEPGGLLGLYCYMDESLWQTARCVIFCDKSGNRYAAPVTHEKAKGLQPP